MKAKVNEECIGCGLCVSIAEDVFRMNDEGLAEAYGEVTEENKEAVLEAADSCPVAAIEIE
ncbi:MAG: ferredoxin [Monoglobales bacterium]